MDEAGAVVNRGCRQPLRRIQSTLFERLIRLVQRVYGDFPATVGHVKEYVEQYPIGFRGGRYTRRDTGEPQFGIFNIFPVME